MIITDENRIKEYCNHPRCMILPKDWDELWRTSVCVRGILVENIAEDKIEDKMFGIEPVDERIEKSSKPLLPYAQYTTYILCSLKWQTKIFFVGFTVVMRILPMPVVKY